MFFRLIILPLLLYCFVCVNCADCVLAQRRKPSLIAGPDSVAEKTDTDANKKAVKKPAPTKAAAKPAPKKNVDIFGRPMADKKTTANPRGPGGRSGQSTPQAKDAQQEVPPPESVTVISRQPGTEGINLACTLFMSPLTESEESKNISPVMLIHDWGGSMIDLAPLALHLQSAGHTVLLPDLRGHGRSTTMVNSPIVIDYDEFGVPEIASISRDLEACKRFLMQYNNDGKLNINMLSVMAVGDMCPVVTEWVLRDWSFPNFGQIKQGKDVQSLILVSPKRKFKKFAMSRLVKHPLLSGKETFHIPTLIIWGSAGKGAKESNTIYKQLAKNRPESTASDFAQRWVEQDLFKLVLPVAGDGAELLRPNKAIYNFISNFNQQKVLVAPERFPWQSRAPDEKKAKQK